MACTRCDGKLEPISLKGYRLMVDVGKTIGPEVLSKSCTSCGLIHFYDPRYARTAAGEG